MNGTEDARIWAQFDKIDKEFDKVYNKFDEVNQAIVNLSTQISNLAAEVRASKEASEARLKKLEDEADHAKASRGKAFDKIDKMSARITDLEIAPARKALETQDTDKKIIRTEIIRRLTTLGIGVILIIVTTIGAGIVVKQYGSITSSMIK